MNYFIYILLFALSIQLNAQAPSKFYQRWGGNGYDIGYDVKQTLDSGYVIAGSTSSFGAGNTDMYLAKLDKMGQLKFQKAIGNYNNENAKSVVQLIDSSYVMLGYTNSSGFGGYDMYLVKTDKLGNLIWQKNFGGTDWDFGNSLQSTTDGGFIIAGTTYSYGRGNADGYVIKTDNVGNALWTKTYGGVNDDEFKSVIQTADGGYALTGYTKSYADATNGDIWVFKLDVLGDSVWCKFYGGIKEDFGNCVIEHPNSNLFISGASETYSSGMLDGYAIRLDNLGNVLNTVSDGTASFSEQFNSIAVSKRDNNKLTVIEKEDFFGYKLQFKIMELNINLSYSSATDYGSTSDDETFAIIPTFDKGFACVGYTTGYGAILTDAYLVKVDSALNGGNYSIVGIEDFKLDSYNVNIFPIPANNKLNIQFNNIAISPNISIYNIYGQLITKYLKTEINNEIILNVSNLNDGIYFLKLNNLTKKIIIEH